MIFMCNVSCAQRKHKAETILFSLSLVGGTFDFRSIIEYLNQKITDNENTGLLTGSFGLAVGLGVGAPAME